MNSILLMQSEWKNLTNFLQSYFRHSEFCSWKGFGDYLAQDLHSGHSEPVSASQLSLGWTEGLVMLDLPIKKNNGNLEIYGESSNF